MRLPMPSKYHPSVDRIRPGSRVGSRTDGRPIGDVDSLGEGGGSRWAIVSWPAIGHPAAPTDDRGRRGQAFDVTALSVLDPPDQAHIPEPDLNPQEE
jgi:hypothetical protein